MLYVDGLLALTYALFHFAFPQNILKLIVSPSTTVYTRTRKIQIRSSIDLDSHHYMWCRVWGALWLIPALTSLAALQALPHAQLSHLFARLVVSVTVVATTIMKWK